MVSENNNNAEGIRLKSYLSSVSVWALSLGCAVGWGAFVMPANTFLPMAGPLGSFIGLLVGAILMIIIGRNYQYMMDLYPDAGGTFTYTRNTFGNDHGFLSAWFLVLTYVAIIWANITALALIARNVFGRVLQFGFHYTLAGYDIYFGEVILEIVILVLLGILVMNFKRVASCVNMVFAFILILGIVFCFFLVMMEGTDFHPNMYPPFDTDADISHFRQILNIIALTPWAFIGFESVSHSAEEYKFPVKKSFGIMSVAVITGLIGYVFPTFMAASVRPDGYDNWHIYLSDLGNLSDVESMPVFYSVYSVVGEKGLLLLGVIVLGGIVTGIVGNTIAVSRLLYSMSQENLLPSWFGKLTKDGTPANAVKFITLLSMIIPFFGRTAIGWIVDVTTIGATVAYGYTSASAYKTAKKEGDKGVCITGLTGFIAAVFFSVFLLVPNLWSLSTLAAESYLILAFWAISGFIYFRYVFKRDGGNKYGKTTIVWVFLLFLIFFTSLMWMRQSLHQTSEVVIADVDDYLDIKREEFNIPVNKWDTVKEEKFLENEMDKIRDDIIRNSVIQMILIAVAIYIMFNVYTELKKREKKMEIEKIVAENSSKAKTIFLSNMSHDIRTPMNTIIGYTSLAKRDSTTQEELKEYLNKIENSSQHLLSLINDILEMSHIESGKVKLDEIEVNLWKVLAEVCDMFSIQMREKNIEYTVDYQDIQNIEIYCDKNRLYRVLQNLVSNAYKYTPEGGKVAVKITQKGEPSDGRADYEISVKDTGMGMKSEFAEKVFDAFERERTEEVDNIQGTGLGMAITKSIIDLMDGEIKVITAPGEGTEFLINLSFRVKYSQSGEMLSAPEAKEEEIDFSKKKLLVVEDVEINREMIVMILSEFGFNLETAGNGQEAVNKVAAVEDGYFDAILMDVQMPIMNGYNATKKIREMGGKNASVPIIAMTANAFSEDVKEAIDAGMNAHVAKPIDIKKLMNTLKEFL